MVAYSFAQQFRQAVALGLKTQTVRADRKRHAQPGERVQLYAAMRTKHCCKLVDPDPWCIGVNSIEIMVTRQNPEIIGSIAIADTELTDEEIEHFAFADGFNADIDRSARRDMGLFWLKTHGEGLFTGVLIQWAEASSPIEEHS